MPRAQTWDEDGVTSSRLQPDESWITSSEAARHLCASRGSFDALTTDIKDAWATVRKKSRSTSGKGARGAGWLFHRADLDVILQIRRVCGLSLKSAVRVFAALRRGEMPAAERI